MKHGSIGLPRTRWLLTLAVALAASCGGSSPVASGGPDEQLFQQALGAFDALDYATCRDDADALWATYPSSARRDNAGYLRGRCRYELTLYADAVTAFEEMMTAYPTSPLWDSAAYFDGRSYFQLARYSEAISQFEASLANDPQGTFADNAAYFVGRCHYEIGKAQQPYDHAELGTAATLLASFETAWASSSYLDNARYYLGRCYFDMGLDTLNSGGSDPADFTASLAPFERVITPPATDPAPIVDSSFEDNARYYHGRAEFHLGNDAAAAAEFSILVQKFPASVYADNALRYEIRAYIGQTNCAAARATFTQLQTDYPTSTEIPLAQADLTAGGC